VDPKTNESLLSALREASQRKMSHQEIQAQKVSFVYGSISPKSSVTRERIRQLLAEQEGETVQANG
jgi:hypothetical protein